MLFGIILSILYDKHGHLQYLNSILKINDIICSEILFSNQIMISTSESIKLLKKESDIINKFLTQHEE